MEIIIIIIITRYRCRARIHIRPAFHNLFGCCRPANGSTWPSWILFYSVSLTHPFHTQRPPATHTNTHTRARTHQHTFVGIIVTRVRAPRNSLFCSNRAPRRTRDLPPSSKTRTRSNRRRGLGISGVFDEG